MDRLRRRLNILGLLIILLMFLFPPFHVMYAPGIEIEKGYAFILNPPTFWGKVESTVDMSLLLFQVGMIVAMLGAFQLFVKMYKK
jgi:hypothetical protein